MPASPPAERDERSIQAAPEEHRSPAAAPLDYRPPLRQRKPPFIKTLRFRQTVIPILLTVGMMMLVIPLARWVVDEDAPLARLPGWTIILLIGTGLSLLALAVVNMMLVRDELAEASSSAGGESR